MSLHLKITSLSRRVCLSILFAVGACLSVLRAEVPKLSDKGRASFEVLKNTQCFSSTAVGFAGSTPGEVFAFRDLLDEPNADAAFKVLVKEASPEGQLYAVCGLWFTDPVEFKVQIKAREGSAKSVMHMEGCDRGEEKVSRLIWSKKTGAVRLKNNQQTIKEWLDEAKPGNMFYDIGGGAWPSMLRDEGGFRKPKREPGKRS